MKCFLALIVLIGVSIPFSLCAYEGTPVEYGERFDTYKGSTENAPWCHGVALKDDAGKWRIDYDVSVGEATHSIEIRNPEVLSRGNTLLIELKGDAASLSITLFDGKKHTCIIQHISDVWQIYTVPFDAFSEYDRLAIDEITSISLTVSSDKADNLIGSVWVGSLHVATYPEATEPTFESRVPSPILSINDQPIAEPLSASRTMNIRAKYAYEPEENSFLGVLFEASVDKKTWWYIGEDTRTDDVMFETVWNTEGYESGEYFVRAVALFRDNRRGEGRPAPVTIENPLSSEVSIEELERRCFLYFVKERDISSGLIKKRTGPDAQCGTIASGMGLTAFCVGIERGYIPREEGMLYLSKILSVYEEIPLVKGIFSEYVDPVSLQPKGTETLRGTAYMAAGALCVMEYVASSQAVEEKEVYRKAQNVFHRIKWNTLDTLFEDNGTRRGDLIAILMGLGSGGGSSLKARWEEYKEKEYLLWYGAYQGLSSLTWDVQSVDYCWVRPSEVNHARMDYEQAVQHAILMAREYTYRVDAPHQEVWGMPSFGKQPGKNPPPLHGAYRTDMRAPFLAVSAVSIVPPLGKAALATIMQSEGTLWGEYGLYDSKADPTYNAETVGQLLMHCANYRTQSVWKWYMRSPVVKRGLERAGLR